MDVFRGDHWDIMLLITNGLCRIAKDNNINIPQKVQDDVYNFLLQEKIIESEQERSAGMGSEAGVNAGLPLIGDIFGAFTRIKGDMKYNEVTKNRVSETISKRHSEWMGYTKLIADLIKKHCCGKEPVLIFESLDKFDMNNQSGRIFEIFRYSPLSAMPFPIIYTFPISQYYAPQFADLDSFYRARTFPMLKVINIDGSRYDEGIDSVRAIVAERIAEGFTLFSDETDENGDDILTMMIVKTGGLLRQLFECIINAAMISRRGGNSQIGLDVASHVLIKIQSDLTSKLEGDDYKKLAQIYEDEKLREKIEDKHFLLNMLRARTIVEYNGKRWHDVHPLVADFLASVGMVTLRGKK
jgi:hypothetical protein